MSNENLTEQTLADVQAGIPARDAEIAALRKENAELREQLEAVGAGGVNGRLMPGAVSAEPVAWMLTGAHGHTRCVWVEAPSAEMLEMAKIDGDTVTPLYSRPVAAQAPSFGPATVLPDGSAFAVASFPLPKDHWLYAEREYDPGSDEPKELPPPILTHAQRANVVAAIRYAVRGATMCGKESDFDPDALVQNAVYALCGPFGDAIPAAQAQQPVSCADGLRVVLEEIHDWMDSQADAQSKGCHATFDIMMLREFRDKAKFALDHFPDATKMVPGDQFRDAAQMIEPSGSGVVLDERAEFEKAWTSYPGRKTPIRFDDGEYQYPAANTAWKFWQARAALAHQDGYKTAFEEWHRKTEFIQDWFNSNRLPVKYLGWHRADVLRDLVEQQDADTVDALVYRTLLDNCISCEVNYEEGLNDENMVRDFILTFRLGGDFGNNIRGMLSKPLSEFAERCIEFDAASKEQA